MLKMELKEAINLPIKWELNWKTCPIKLVATSDAATFFIKFADIPSANQFYQKAKRYLSRRLEVKAEADDVEEGNNKSIVKAYCCSKLVMCMKHFSLYDHVQVTAYGAQFESLVRDMVMALLEDEELIAEVWHGKHSKTLDGGLSVESVTGEYACQGSLDGPVSLFALKCGDQCIGRAYVKYDNGEMGDFAAPAIELFEIAGALQGQKINYAFRGQGFGLRFLKAMRSIFKSQGFDRVWATYIMDTNAVGFWKKAGFRARDHTGEMVLRWL